MFWSIVQVAPLLFNEEPLLPTLVTRFKVFFKNLWKLTQDIQTILVCQTLRHIKYAYHDRCLIHGRSCDKPVIHLALMSHMNAGHTANVGEQEEKKALCFYVSCLIQRYNQGDPSTSSYCLPKTRK